MCSLSFQETIDQVVDTALLCIGRIPNTSSLDLDKAGVQVDPKSASIIEKNGQTTAPHIWAAGDVTADVSLANVAEMEGIHAVDCILGGKTDKLRFDNLSTIMFFDPLVSAVGMGEQALQKVEPTHLKTHLRADELNSTQLTSLNSRPPSPLLNLPSTSLCPF